MASRENQGYLIAVIVLVLVTLLLAITAFFGINSANSSADQLKSNQSKLLVQEKLAQAEQVKSQILEAMVGGFGVSVAEIQTLADRLENISNDPNLDSTQKSEINEVKQRVALIRAEYEKDMKQNIASEGEDSQEFTYKTLVNNLAAVVANKHNEVNVLRNDINRITNDAQKQIERKDNEIATMQSDLTEKQNELDTEKQRASEKITQLTNTLDSIRAANEETNKTLANQAQTYNQKLSELNGQLTTVAAENQTLKEKVNVYEQETFDLPDGEVVRVNSEFVYINLGSADGLRTNRTFSVYDQTVTNFEKGKQKATIEVTTILGPHQAEARVTSQQYIDPILQGDYVLTPTWDPGSRVAIALVGMFDLDGDGRSDRERLVQMIQTNGGEVVAQHDEEGNLIGKIDSSTRYLVLGYSPEPGPGTPTAVFNSIDTLLSQAKKNSVQEIDIKKLLNWMGMHRRGQIEHLESSADSGFRRREAKDILQGNKPKDNN